MVHFGKKFLIATLAIAVVAGTMSGCSGASSSSAPDSSSQSPSSQAKPSTVNFAYWGAQTEANAIKAAVANFQSNNSSITIKQNWIQSDYLTKIQTMIAGGTAPDVMLISVGDLPGFCSNFTTPTVDASQYTSKNLVDAMSFGGTTYAMPFIIKPKVMAVNVDVFKARNVPVPSQTQAMTPQQFQETALKLVSGAGSKKIYGSEQLWFGNWLYSFGGSYYKDGKSALDSSADLQAFNFLVDSRKLGYTPTNAEAQGQDMMNWFLSGRIGMYTDFGPWNLPQLADSTINWELVPFPSGGGSKEVDGLAVCKTSKNQDAANTFVTYMSTNDAAQKIIGGDKNAYGVPVISSAVSAFQTIFPDKDVTAFLTEAKDQTVQEAQKQTNQINTIMNEITDRTALGSGKEAPSAVLPEVAAKVNKILEGSN